MSTAYQHRPLSKILAQPAGEQPEGQARDEQGRFTKAPEAAEQDTNEPEKYKDKSREDIIAMHQNAESAYGRSQNEVGQLRGLVKDLSQLQRAAPPATEPQDVDLSGDDLLTDPVGSIKKVVQSVQTPKPEPESDPLDNLDYANETQALVTEFPNMEEIAMSPEFADFVNRTPSRLRDQQIAADPEAGIESVRAARRLLEDYKDFQTQTSQPADKTNDAIAAAKAVANEPGHAGATVPEDVIYEADVIAMANSEPEKYRSPSFQAKLIAAIKEGRYIKQS